MQDLYNEPQPTDLGENGVVLVPDPLKLDKDRLLEDIAKFKRYAENNMTSNIAKLLIKVEEELTNQAPKRGILANKRNSKVRGVNTSNIKDGKRVRFSRKNLQYKIKVSHTMKYR